MKKIILFLIIFILFASYSYAQVIKLRSGQTISGKIIKKTNKYIVVDQGLGQAVTYYMDVEKELVGEAPQPEKKPEVPNPTSPEETTEAPLPEINYDAQNPNITEYELKKTMEIYQLALNTRKAKGLSRFVSNDAKFFCQYEHFKYNYTGASYVDMMKARWLSKDFTTYEFNLEKFVLEGPRATTEETVKKIDPRNSSEDQFRQKVIYEKLNGKVQIISNELLVEELKLPLPEGPDD